MDITEKSVVTAVEWFHGYGGNALGLKRAIPGLQSVAVCERDAFVVANMVSKMEKGLLDAVPIWTDVTDFPCKPFGYQQLDLFVASYPCQGFSHAGKRLGTDDHRHLWPYCRKFIVAVRPGWVWLENVEGHVSLGLSTVLSDLEEDGYKAAWGIFSASEVGAPHQRKRVFILAYDMRRAESKLPRSGESGRGGAPESRRSIWPGASGGDNAGDKTEGSEGGPIRGLCEDVAQREDIRWGGGIISTSEQPGEKIPTSRSGIEARNVWPSRPGQPQYAWEPPRVVGDPGLQRQEIGQVQAAGAEQPDKGGSLVNPYDMGRASHFPRQRCDIAKGLSGKPASEGAGDRSQIGQAQPALGGNADGPAAGLDLAGLSGLGDPELAEIREWMVKGTNRTDELRMCGNGVVPATAARAWTVLYKELTEGPNGLD